jgi:ABC-type branched-subunit amino acid transport system substrate-binding protein
MIQVDKPPWRGSRWRGAATDRRGPVLWAALMSLAALHASALPGHTRAAALSLRATPGVPRTSGVLTLGVMVTLRGPFAALGVEGLRGVALAVAEVHGRVGATRIAVAVAGTAGTPATATAAGRTLLDRDGPPLWWGRA